MSIALFPVRRLLVDLKSGFARHWHGGDAFKTQFFNALSMSFPVGEQSFIDSVKAGLDKLPDTTEHAALRQLCAQFIGQEATHRHLHGIYNAQLTQQGLVNHWEGWANTRLAEAMGVGVNPLHFLAVTAAYEHFTAVFADGSLRHGWLDGAEPRMQQLWLWHACEEIEHRSVAFDLYRALGGDERWRKRWFVRVALIFSWDATRQTVSNLWHDGELFKPRTVISGLRFLLGTRGLLTRSVRPLLQYLRTGFHPTDSLHTARQQDSATLADAWLSQHANLWQAVR